jgi:ascorbate-specific PTS system EIIC-type component UlaA
MTIQHVLVKIIVTGLEFIGALLVLMMVIITVRTVIAEVMKALRRKAKAQKIRSGGEP